MKKYLIPFTILILAACSTVPITGRKRISFIPEGQLLTLSDQNYKEVLSGAQISKDPGWNAKVRDVGQRIASAAGGFMKENGMQSQLQNYHWEFNLIDDPKTVNAFCMPGGKIVVYTGILPVVQDENGLATVMSHEVAHALANHGGERMSQELLVKFGGESLTKLMKTKPQQVQDMVSKVYGAGAQYGLLLPYSRAHELEADHIGLILMARAGFDPHAALPFWQRMSSLGSSGPEFLATHPSSARRVADITREIPEAMKYYKPA